MLCCVCVPGLVGSAHGTGVANSPQYSETSPACLLSIVPHGRAMAMEKLRVLTSEMDTAAI